MSTRTPAVVRVHRLGAFVARLLPTAGAPTKDAADALAVAIAHAHARRARNFGAAA